jgi:transcriptional regulator
MRDKKRENTVLTMRSKGFTFQNIGTVLGVTRQRAHQIFARKAIEKRLEAL